MEEKMKLAVILSAYDKMSMVVNSAVNKSQAKLRSFAKSADKMAQASFTAGQQMVASGVAVGAPILAATQRAIDFEEAMAGIGKVMNMANGSKELKSMANEAQRLAVYLGKAPTDAAALMANLAQGGADAGNLAEVSKIAGEMAVAFDLTADVAGDRFMKLKNALGISVSETKQAADAMNYLSDRTAAKASQLLDFMAAGGASVAKTLKLSAPEMQAFGATMISMGKSGEETGTIMQRFQKGVLGDDGLRKMFLAAGGGAQGLMAVLKAGASIKDQTKQFEFFHRFGEYGTSIAQFANNYSQLAQNMDSVADVTKFANSVNAEFQNRQNTTAGRLAKVKAQAEVLAIKLGESLLPAITKLVDAVSPMIVKFTAWAERNPGLVSGIMKAAAAFAALSLAGGYLSFAFGGVAKFAGILGRVFAFILNPLKFLLMGKWQLFRLIVRLRYLFTGFGSVVVRVFNIIRIAVLSNPILAIVAAIAVAAFLIYKNWDKIGPMLAKVFKRLWEIVKMYFGFIFNLHKKFFTAGVNIVKSIWEGIKSFASKPIEAIKGMVQKIRNLLPFSPAKDGPLKDIHRIKLVETIADSIKPAALVNKMRSVVGLTADVAMPRSVGASGASTSSAAPVFHITVNMNGSDDTTNGNNIAQRIRSEVEKAWKDYNAQRARVSFG